MLSTSKKWLTNHHCCYCYYLIVNLHRNLVQLVIRYLFVEKQKHLLDFTLIPNPFMLFPHNAILEGKMNVYRAIITSKVCFGRWRNRDTVKLSNWSKSSDGLKLSWHDPTACAVYDTKGFSNSWTLSTKSSEHQKKCIFIFTYFPNDTQVFNSSNLTSLMFQSAA